MGRSMWTGMAIAGAVALLLSGCDGGGGDPPATTVPSAPASSAADPTSPSAPATSAEPSETQEDKDFAEAAHAIEEANRIIDEVLMEPDKHKKYPKELKKYADPAGQYWDLQAYVLEKYRAEGQRFSTTSRIVKLQPVGEYDPDELTFYRCTDAKDLKVLDKKGRTVSTGTLSDSRIVVRKIDSRWLLWEYVEYDNGGLTRTVDSCEENPT